MANCVACSNSFPRHPTHRNVYLRPTALRLLRRGARGTRTFARYFCPGCGLSYVFYGRRN